MTTNHNARSSSTHFFLAGFVSELCGWRPPTFYVYLDFLLLRYNNGDPISEPQSRLSHPRFWEMKYNTRKLRDVVAVDEKANRKSILDFKSWPGQTLFRGLSFLDQSRPLLNKMHVSGFHLPPIWFGIWFKILIRESVLQNLLVTTT